MKDQTAIIIVALVLLAIVEIFALALGFDGVMLISVIGIFGYAIGYKHKDRRAPVPAS